MVQSSRGAEQLDSSSLLPDLTKSSQVKSKVKSDQAFSRIHVTQNAFYSTFITASASWAFVASAVPAPTSPTATDDANVKAAQATALASIPTSKIKGTPFDRRVSIWIENTGHDIPAEDCKSHYQTTSIWKYMPPPNNKVAANFQLFAKEGITLSQKYAVTHPSEPSYMTAAGG
ncbi:uncharacterized protein L3040_009470 [Drepanopeziza brunnea f. sp. 'multigermtubi']|uniref:Acid phosphatase phoa n=1 Tax=Marssonina brunnea f. sp. multigermtubi (strain MB_m1) TaxID=1072389 RepID=K1X6N2_MARBU|nr:acid phosphatase phoa [Drepanopeziza brunnea f. sp. 'multigermtubi' MB_m1]EKD16298.1 acid phosphatase phoa [Drepanopeziza brunnea f. sp. 'multigermtubi' MB_m1]KAJ5032879.1 hypothetical protein L3040_009470 [Drepanopeziza brunnea f. sp. 'multigermtubi']